MSKILVVDEGARQAAAQAYAASQNENWLALETATRMQDGPDKAAAMFGILANANFPLTGVRDIHVKLGNEDFELNRNEYMVLQCARLVKLRGNDTVVSDWQRLLSAVSAHSQKICERVALMALNYADKMSDFQIVVGSEKKQVEKTKDGKTIKETQSEPIMGSAKAEIVNITIIYGRNFLMNNDVCNRALPMLETLHPVKFKFWSAARDSARKAADEVQKQKVA